MNEAESIYAIAKKRWIRLTIANVAFFGAVIAASEFGFKGAEFAFIPYSFPFLGYMFFIQAEARCPTCGKSAFWGGFLPAFGPQKVCSKCGEDLTAAKAT